MRCMVLQCKELRTCHGWNNARWCNETEILRFTAKAMYQNLLWEISRRLRTRMHSSSSPATIVCVFSFFQFDSFIPFFWFCVYLFPIWVLPSTWVLTISLLLLFSLFIVLSLSCKENHMLFCPLVNKINQCLFPDPFTKSGKRHGLGNPSHPSSSPDLHQQHPLSPHHLHIFSTPASPSFNMHSTWP